MEKTHRTLENDLLNEGTATHNYPQREVLCFYKFKTSLKVDVGENGDFQHILNDVLFDPETIRQMALELNNRIDFDREDIIQIDEVKENCFYITLNWTGYCAYFPKEGDYNSANLAQEDLDENYPKFIKYLKNMRGLELLSYSTIEIDDVVSN